MTNISIWGFRTTEFGEGACEVERSKQVTEVEMRRKQPFKELGEERSRKRDQRVPCPVARRVGCQGTSKRAGWEGN